MSEGAVEPRGGITLHCLGDVRIESHLVVIVEWRRFPAIGLFFLQVATEQAVVSSIFTAAQVEAFAFGSQAGLRAGRSASAAWNDQEAPAG